MHSPPRHCLATHPFSSLALAHTQRQVCDAFLSLLGLHPRVMQPAFGMAEVCTCMTYNTSYNAHKSFDVYKHSLAYERLRLVDDDSAAAAGSADLGDGSDMRGRDAGVARFVDLGPISPGVEMRIAAESGGTRVLDELQVGHLQVCSFRGEVGLRWMPCTPLASHQTAEMQPTDVMRCVPVYCTC